MGIMYHKKLFTHNGPPAPLFGWFLIIRSQHSLSFRLLNIFLQLWIYKKDNFITLRLCSLDKKLNTVFGLIRVSFLLFFSWCFWHWSLAYFTKETFYVDWAIRGFIYGGKESFVWWYLAGKCLLHIHSAGYLQFKYLVVVNKDSKKKKSLRD